MTTTPDPRPADPAFVSGNDRIDRLAADPLLAASAETVHVRIVIDIQADDTLDTGLTVAQWNALDPAARRTIIRNQWDGMLGCDNGSVTILPNTATRS